MHTKGRNSQQKFLILLFANVSTNHHPQKFLTGYESDGEERQKVRAEGRRHQLRRRRNGSE